MKIGFASLIGVEPVPFPDLVRWAADHDLRAIEVNVGSTFAAIDGAAFPGHLDLRAIVQDGPGPLPELLASHGVEIASLAPMVNLLTADHALREERIGEVRTAIDACAKLGVATLVTFAGSAYGMHFWGMPGSATAIPPIGSPTTSASSARSTVRSPIYAEDRGVRIAFETAGRGGPEGNLAHSPELWDAMFDAVPSPALGLSFDPSHLVWLHIPNIPDVIRAYGPRIYHVDGKDTEILRGPPRPPGHPRQRLVALPAAGAAACSIGGRSSRRCATSATTASSSIENEDPLCPGLHGRCLGGGFLRRQLFPPPEATVSRRRRVASDRGHWERRTGRRGRVGTNGDGGRMSERRLRAGLIGCGKIAHDPRDGAALAPRGGVRRLLRPRRSARPRGSRPSTACPSVYADAGDLLRSGRGRRRPRLHAPSDPRPRWSSRRPRPACTSSARNRSPSIWARPTG